jgi:hypothetical protein
MALAVRYDESLALLSEVERDISAPVRIRRDTFGGARAEGR